MKKYIKYIIYTMLIFLFLISGIYAYKINDKNYSKENIIETKEKLNKEKTYDFVAKYDDLKKIEIKFNTNSWEDDKDKIKISLYNKDEKEIKKVVVKQLDYKKSYALKFDKIKNSANQEYKIIIENTSNIKDLNVEAITANYYKGTNKSLFIIITTVITVITIALMIILEKKNFKIETTYLIIAMFVYFSFILFFPLFTSHDELYHWFRAYEVSEGKLLSEVHENKALSLLPSAIGEIYNVDFQEIDYRTTKATLPVEKNDNKNYYDMRTVAVYSPVQYIPQSIGIFIARIFTNKTLVMAYCGRLFNALLAIALIYFAIKIIPIGKRIIFTIGFLPIAVEGFTSLSADAITISVATLLLAYILHLAYDKKVDSVKKKDYALILLLSSILALCKIVYLPIVLLCFLIPKEKFKDKKNYFKFCISIVLISVVLNLVWLKIASGYLSLYSTTEIQVSYIFKHPLEFIMIVVHTFFANAKQYLFTMVGEGLGWGERVHPYSIVLIGYLALLILNALFDDYKKVKLDTKVNCIFSIIPICVIGLIFTSLYIQFTTPGNPTIMGVQGRYFLPILPIILLLLGNFKGKISQKINSNKITAQLCLILSYSVILTLIVQYL